MCGRFAQITPSADIINIFEVHGPFEMPVRYNIAPSQDVAVIRAADQQRQLAMLRWGLVPRWAKDLSIGYKTFNARSETVHEKPSFKAAFKSRRCLVPASGFYEWDRVGKTRQPYYITRSDRRPIAFAGLWESWTDHNSGEIIESCTILTTVANRAMSRIHHRMPVILEQNDFGFWLDGQSHRADDFTSVFQPPGDDLLKLIPVSTYVNKAGNEGVKCIKAL